jgi:hypothetical protein
MAFVTITEAAKLVRRSRRTLYRDMDSGRLSKTLSSTGTPTIDTAELLRVYGALHKTDDTAPASDRNSTFEDFEELVETWNPVHKSLMKPQGGPADTVHVTILEEQIKSLRHVLELEATLRKVKDEVTSELRARLEDKDRYIKTLENQFLLLGYDGPVEKQAPKNRKGFFASLFRRG